MRELVVQEARTVPLSWRRSAFVVFFWVMTFASAPVLLWTHTTVAGWDLHVYENAVHSVRMGHDPYEDGIAAQRVFHNSALAQRDDIMPPYTYVYSPVTLPLLRLIAHMPPHPTELLYWSAYVASMLLLLWAELQMVQPEERNVLLVIAPAALYFPALLQSNVMFSGNLAYMLYALVMATALLGWKRFIWAPFYVTVFAASCFKAPLLSLVLLAVLSAKKQIVPTLLTCFAGLTVFAMQAVLWPATFRNYLQAVSLQFSYNHDFGFSPSGLLGNTLFFYGRQYSAASTGFYALYAAAILCVLVVVGRYFKAGACTLAQCTPILLMGVVLLNPRVKEYDVAPLTIPMGVVAWRLFARKNRQGRLALEFFLFFLAVNGFIMAGAQVWKPTAGVLLLGFFAAGCWQLFDEMGVARAALAKPAFWMQPPATQEIFAATRASLEIAPASSGLWRRGETYRPHFLVFSAAWYDSVFGQGVDENAASPPQFSSMQEVSGSKKQT